MANFRDGDILAISEKGLLSLKFSSANRNSACTAWYYSFFFFNSETRIAEIFHREFVQIQK